MAAAVATAATPPTDNRCVGGGGDPPVIAIRPQTVPLPSSTIPALTSSTVTRLSGRRRRGGNGLHPNTSHRSSISSRSSSPSSSSASDDDEESVAAFGNHGVMVANRLKDLQQHLVDFEDLELLDRHLIGANDGGGNVGPEHSCPQNTDADNAAGIAAELRQKNKDLILAARLGKALLAKNDELSLMNERLAEEYGDKLEVRAYVSNYYVITLL